MVDGGKEASLRLLTRMIAALESGKYEVKTSVVVTGPRGEGELNLGTGELFREGDSVTCNGGHTTGVGDL